MSDNFCGIFTKSPTKANFPDMYFPWIIWFLICCVFEYRSDERVFVTSWWNWSLSLPYSGSLAFIRSAAYFWMLLVAEWHGGSMMFSPLRKLISVFKNTAGEKVLLFGWDPLMCTTRVNVTPQTLLPPEGPLRNPFSCLLRPWPSSMPRWSRTTRLDGVHVQSQRSSRTCRISPSAKETVWGRFVCWRQHFTLKEARLPFLMSRCHQVADWTGATYQDKRYTSKTTWNNGLLSLSSSCKKWSSYRITPVTHCIWSPDKYSSQFGGGSQYAYFHEEDETSFQLVDTAKTQKTAYQRNRMRFAQARPSARRLKPLSSNLSKLW